MKNNISNQKEKKSSLCKRKWDCDSCDRASVNYTHVCIRTQAYTVSRPRWQRLLKDYEETLAKVVEEFRCEFGLNRLIKKIL